MSKNDSKNGFNAVSPKVSFPELEVATSEYWKKNKIFEKSIESRPEDKRWTFLDGPPFVTGMPHYGTLLSSLPKDLYGRFWTMKGYRVARRWGWDGHGLPIENKVENKLGIKRKKDIEDEIGVKKFIEECRTYLNQMSAEWEWYVDRIGRWVDFKNAYKTWDLDYMESVMWVFKQMYEKDHIYKGLRVTLYCPHCETPISNFEIAMDNSYKEVPDAATTYKYELTDEPGTFILAWSTTPWNKIVTPALAVNPKFDYIKVRQGKENYILAESTKKMLKGDFEVLETFKGSDLVGKRYVPHYDYYSIEEGKRAFEVIPGDFVTADEGTGVVTIAAYGIEDLDAMKKNNIHIEMHVNEEGIIKPEVPKFGGMYYLKANKAVNEDLAARGLIYDDKETLHNVAICWRCSTRLYYAPLNAWFVNVQKLKPLLKETNEKINWFPKHFKHGRFLKSLESAPDWNISRNRYWGSPIPVWECDKCGERFVPGSIKELEEAAGVKITDLHKPEIDEVIVKCAKCGSDSHRTPEVLDSWIEAGSASFAERHFPFNTSEKLEDFFPPDFIEEYTGQIRAWFYVLHVIGGALYDSPAFKNVSVTGVIMGTDGRKMSKNFKNYPDPREMLEKYGGDALRLYLMGSPVMHAEDIIISEENYKQQVRGTLLILWNVYNFFVSYANIDGWNPGSTTKKSENVLDAWILSLTHKLIRDITKSLDEYDTMGAVSKVDNFVNSLSTWYIRRSRDRVGPTAEDKSDKEAFYETTFEVLILLTKVLAPIVPFISEEIYRNLTGEESVHLADWPTFDESLIDEELEKEMINAQAVASVIQMRRKTNNLPISVPLLKVSYTGPVDMGEDVKKIVREEINVDELIYSGKAGNFENFGTEKDFEGEFTNPSNQNLAAGEARKIIRKIQAERKNLGTELDEKVDVELDSWPEAFESEIKRKALVNNLKKSDQFKVSRLNA